MPRENDVTKNFTAKEFSDLAADVRRADRITFYKDCDDRFGGDSANLDKRGREVLIEALDLVRLKWQQ